MFVDDFGARNDSSVNSKATALYHAICNPGVGHRIHGHVVLCKEVQRGPTGIARLTAIVKQSQAGEHPP